MKTARVCDVPMVVVFLTNNLTLHQEAIYDTFLHYPNTDFYFIECENPHKAVAPIGWRSGKVLTERVVSYEQFQANRKTYDELILTADVVIIGAAPERLVSKRLRARKLTFRYSERFYKKGLHHRPYLRNLLAAWLHHGRLQKYPLYMLCASAYTAADAAVFGNYLNRCYKWGYFPVCRQHEDVAALIANKQPRSLLWAGRMLDLKHPELPVAVAKRLKEEGYDFHLNMIGSGEKEEEIRNLVHSEGLDDCVSLLGRVSPEEVRQYMEQSEIFLFTSDRNEGWGAVLNESMNGACAVVASHAIGATPFLVQHEQNGLIYRDGDRDDLYRNVRRLLDDAALREAVSLQAYATIADEWNAKTAVDKFMKLACRLLADASDTDVHAAGVCSKAELLADDWF